MFPAIRADTRDTCEASIWERCALEQNSAELGAAIENVIWPFDRNPRITAKDFAQGMGGRDASDKTKFGRLVLRRRIDQEQACMKVAQR